MSGNGRSFSGGGPSQSVDPSNAAFAGGSIKRARNPVGVSSGFTTPSVAGGPPPSFGTPATAFARNDRGSNIRIPYARVVPMHSKDALFVNDEAITGTGRSWAYEYDGLDSGEVAWIMSKQFPPPSSSATSSTPVGYSPLDLTSFARNVPSTLEEMKYLIGSGNASPAGLHGHDGAMKTNNSPSGIGWGPDRMQRMAYTKWIEALFIQRIGRQSIDLAAITIKRDDQGEQGHPRHNDSELDYYSKLRLRPSIYSGEDAAPDDNEGDDSLRGCAQNSSIFAVPDIAYGLQLVQQGQPLQVAVPQLQGLFLMEQGPFLRGYGVDHDPVTIVAHGIQGRAGRGREMHIEVDRHLGSELAQRALTAELKRIGLFNWTPDGICLSKYATGPDGQADAEFDARSGQLFNVGVQGPCISTSWVGRKDMACMPMDKVFMLVVGSLSYAIAVPHDTWTGALPQVRGADNDVRDRAIDCVHAAAEMTKCLALANFTPISYDPNAPGPPLKKVESNRAVGYASREGDGLAANKEKREEAYVRNSDGANSDGYAIYAKCSKQMRDAKLAFEDACAEFDLAAAKHKTAGTDVAIHLLKAKGLLAKAEFPQSWEKRKEILNDAAAEFAEVRAAVGKEARGYVHTRKFKRIATQLRQGHFAVKRAVLSNFRIMRATSSFLINNSHADSPAVSPLGWETSRCGLPIGCTEEARSGNAEYILGGWCIGTVIDAAASRSTIHAGQVRTAPSSMAININVNVEWWSADKLYQNYQDVDRGIYGRDDAADHEQQKTEGTVHMRAQPGFRTAASVVREGVTKGVGNEDDAVTALKTGRGDTEGRFKRPDPNGIDADAGDKHKFTDREAKGVVVEGLSSMWEAAQPELGAENKALAVLNLKA